MKFTVEQNDDNQSWRDLPRVPDGTHRMVIAHAEERQLSYKECPANPNGDCLSMRLRLDDDHRDVFCDIPVQLGWLARQLAMALGQSVSGGELDLSPDALVDEAVTVKVKTYNPKSGAEPVAVVDKFVPAAPAVRTEPKAPPKRRPASGVKMSDAMVAEDEGDDGLPF